MEMEDNGLNMLLNSPHMVVILMADKQIKEQLIKKMYNILGENGKHLICDISVKSWINGLVDSIQNKKNILEYKNSFVKYEYLILEDFYSPLYMKENTQIELYYILEKRLNEGKHTFLISDKMIFMDDCVGIISEIRKYLKSGYIVDALKL